MSILHDYRIMRPDIAAVLISTFATFGLAQRASAALLIYDGFSGYNSGSISGQGRGFGWGGTWSGDAAFVANLTAGLNSPGVPSSLGELDITRAGGERPPLSRNFSAPLSVGTIYSGLMVTISQNTSNITAAELIGAGTSEIVVGDYGGTTNTRFYLDVRTNAEHFVGTGVTQQINTTYYLVTRIDFDANGINERVRLYVNPSASGEPASTTADTNLYDVGALTALHFFCDQAGTSKYDEVRIGTTYADMFTSVPEPSSGLMLGLACLVSLRRSRLKQPGDVTRELAGSARRGAGSTGGRWLFLTQRGR